MFDLNAERNKLGISQLTLAKKVGCSQDTIFKLENKERDFSNLNAATAIRIADFFGIKDLRELLK